MKYLQRRGPYVVTVAVAQRPYRSAANAPVAFKRTTAAWSRARRLRRGAISPSRAGGSSWPRFVPIEGRRQRELQPGRVGTGRLRLSLLPTGRGRRSSLFGLPRTL